jgi:hypothetical protein
MWNGQAYVYKPMGIVYLIASGNIVLILQYLKNRVSDYSDEIVRESRDG